jgi:ribosomal protein S18 acetylase RimI-like enzyme
LAKGKGEDKVNFTKVSDAGSIKRTAVLAVEIWTGHYTAIIGKEQVEYMLEKFQSPEAIAEQIRQGYAYYIIEEGGRGAGYLAVTARGSELYISKLYVKKEMRGRGIGRSAVVFIGELAQRGNFSVLALNVNRGNTSSIEAYKKFGFRVIREEKNSIGSGFFMDDLIMEKILK